MDPRAPIYNYVEGQDGRTVVRDILLERVKRVGQENRLYLAAQDYVGAPYFVYDLTENSEKRKGFECQIGYADVGGPGTWVDAFFVYQGAIIERPTAADELCSLCENGLRCALTGYSVTQNGAVPPYWTPLGKETDD